MTQMCIDTVSLPNVSQYDNILIHRCISSMHRSAYFELSNSTGSYTGVLAAA